MARFSKVIDIPLRMKFINYARLASVAATTASEVSRLVTQQRIERRYDADTVLYVLAAGVRIRGNPFYTVPPQGSGRVHKHRLRLEDAIGDDRLHHVELQLPRFCCERNTKSFPMALKQTWFTTSGITGLTLPGMMLEPGCLGGRLISLRPARGPEARSLRSLHIFESLIARLLITEEYSTNGCVSCVASNRSGARVIGLPVIWARCSVQRLA